MLVRLATALVWCTLNTATSDYHPSQKLFLTPGYLIDEEKHELLRIGEQKRWRSTRVPDPTVRHRSRKRKAT